MHLPNGWFKEQISARCVCSKVNRLLNQKINRGFLWKLFAFVNFVWCLQSRRFSYCSVLLASYSLIHKFRTKLLYKKLYILYTSLSLSHTHTYTHTHIVTQTRIHVTKCFNLVNFNQIYLFWFVLEQDLHYGLF